MRHRDPGGPGQLVRVGDLEYGTAAAAAPENKTQRVTQLHIRLATCSTLTYESVPSQLIQI